MRSPYSTATFCPLTSITAPFTQASCDCEYISTASPTTKSPYTDDPDLRLGARKYDASSGSVRSMARVRSPYSTAIFRRPTSVTTPCSHFSPEREYTSHGSPTLNCGVLLLRESERSRLDLKYCESFGSPRSTTRMRSPYSTAILFLLISMMTPAIQAPCDSEYISTASPTSNLTSLGSLLGLLRLLRIEDDRSGFRGWRFGARK